MIEHVLERDMDLAVPIEAVFAFHSDAFNLEKITPPDVHFRVITPAPIEMRAGTRIEYWLKVFGVRFAWRTLIRSWDPPHGFVDEQERGPYGKWLHIHEFSAANGVTSIHDRVEYRLPLSPLGDIAFPLVRAKLDQIFDFRQREVRKLLGGG